MQQLIPIIIITLLIRTVLINLEKNLNKFYARVMDKTELEALQLHVVETICVLKVCFSPAFFNTM